MEDYFEEMNGKVIKTISNGEESVYIYQFENGDVRSSDGNFFGNINDDCLMMLLKNLNVVGEKFIGIVQIGRIIMVVMKMKSMM